MLLNTLLTTHPILPTKAVSIARWKLRLISKLLLCIYSNNLVKLKGGKWQLINSILFSERQSVICPSKCLFYFHVFNKYFNLDEKSIHEYQLLTCIITTSNGRRSSLYSSLLLFQIVDVIVESLIFLVHLTTEIKKLFSTVGSTEGSERLKT